MCVCVSKSQERHGMKSLRILSDTSNDGDVRFDRFVQPASERFHIGDIVYITSGKYIGKQCKITSQVSGNVNLVNVRLLHEGSSEGRLRMRIHKGHLTTDRHHSNLKGRKAAKFNLPTGKAVAQDSIPVSMHMKQSKTSMVKTAAHTDSSQPTTPGAAAKNQSINSSTAKSVAHVSSPPPPMPSTLLSSPAPPAKVVVTAAAPTDLPVQQIASATLPVGDRVRILTGQHTGTEAIVLGRVRAGPGYLHRLELQGEGYALKEVFLPAQSLQPLSAAAARAPHPVPQRTAVAARPSSSSPCGTGTSTSCKPVQGAAGNAAISPLPGSAAPVAASVTAPKSAVVLSVPSVPELATHIATTPHSRPSTLPVPTTFTPSPAAGLELQAGCTVLLLKGTFKGSRARVIKVERSTHGSQITETKMNGSSNGWGDRGRVMVQVLVLRLPFTRQLRMLADNMEVLVPAKSA